MMDMVVFFLHKTKIISFYLVFLINNTKFIIIITKINSDSIEKIQGF